MSQTEQRRKELLDNIVDIAGMTKFGLDGLISVLGDPNFDQRWPPDMIEHLEFTIKNMHETQKVIMDAVATLTMKMQ